MSLTNYQLVLLDNLIYLNEITKAYGKYDCVKDVVIHLLFKNGDPSNDVGTGSILQDYHSTESGGDVCMMDLDEWIQVLKAILSDSTLCNLKIHNVHQEDTGFRAATFIGEGENIIIFRGTMTAYEWMDDGEGGYVQYTTCQKQALDYVNSLDVSNDGSFTVSGHSKGGNLAMFVALFATNPVIDHWYLTLFP